MLYYVGREVNRLDLEDLSFHELVYEGYKKQVLTDPSRIISVDATKSIKELTNEVCALILDQIKG